MATRATVNISLTPKLNAFLQSRVRSGRYQTTSEVVREALRLLQHQEQQREESLKQLKIKLRRGAAQASRYANIATSCPQKMPHRKRVNTRSTRSALGSAWR